jgi:hypothetical protein
MKLTSPDRDFPVRDLPDRVRPRSLAGCLIFFFAMALSLASDVRAEINFSQQVRPILAEYCIQCHGPDEAQRQADLRLDVASHESTAIVPGDPDASELLKRITSEDSELRMPPAKMEKHLSESQIAILRQWIADGAQYEGHWAFSAIQRPEVPITQAPVATDIDRFIVAKLEAKGLHLRPAVSRAQLIRRATFDLTGLPPTPEEVAAFENDPADDAFAKVVDRLLDSPRYGERWGRLWLDIARYADTHGGSAIGFTRFPFSYTYRDYVIQAFNDDLPYNQFITEQLAADQLGYVDNDPALAAVGFLTVGMQFRSIHDLIDDQIDVVTRGLMGMTVACARCHDHKFDPIPTTDYYALYATFACSQSPHRLPVLGEPEPSDVLADYQRQLGHRQMIYDNMARDQAEVMRGRLRMQVGLYLTELAKGTPEQDVSAAFLSYRTDDIRPIVLNRWREYLQAIAEDDPVFGPWVRLSKLPQDGFADQCQAIVQELTAANGDPAQFANTSSLSMEGPAWNPRVLEALANRQPSSMIEVAEAYGELFATVHRRWLEALLAASLEAQTGGTIYTDEDAQHAEVNSSINQQLRRHLYDSDTPTAVPIDVAVKLLNRTVSDTLGGKRGAIHELHLNAPGSPPRGMILKEDPAPDDYFVFLRGNSLARGERVSAHFLTALSGSERSESELSESTSTASASSRRVPTSFADGQRRLDLARSIVAEDNPLTRRVVVNWIWRNHFGTGLVRTPDDFGTRGTPPTHPQLLDYLATEFSQHDWSMKHMHRQIMLSDVYQQGAIEDKQSREVDPENELLWRMPRHRLDMESMRDAMLAASGELDTSRIGGRPFELDATPIVPRRSVYAFLNRDIISHLSSTFDGADPTSCTAKRPDTMVPQQTLYALNSDFIQDRAAALARLTLAIAGDDTQKVHWLYQRLYGRHPEASEVELMLKFLQSPTAGEPSERAATVEAQTVHVWAQLAHAMLASNEFLYVD